MALLKAVPPATRQMAINHDHDVAASKVLGGSQVTFKARNDKIWKPGLNVLITLLHSTFITTLPWPRAY